MQIRMVVPNEISPIDYIKTSNEHIFVLSGYILRVNFTDKIFDLETPERIAYREHFDFVSNPPEYLDVQFGLVEWIRKALSWNSEEIVKHKVSVCKFVIEEKSYSVRYDNISHQVNLTMPERSIYCDRKKITTLFPELVEIERGLLITEITNYITEVMTYEPLNDNSREQGINGNNYKMHYTPKDDMFHIRLPERSLIANLFTIEENLPELEYLYDGMFYDVLRDVINEG